MFTLALPALWFIMFVNSDEYAVLKNCFPMHTFKQEVRLHIFAKKYSECNRGSNQSYRPPKLYSTFKQAVGPGILQTFSTCAVMPNLKKDRLQLAVCASF